MIEDNTRDEGLTTRHQKPVGPKLISILSLRPNNLKCQKFYKIVCCFLCKMPLVQCVLNVKTILL